MCIRDRLYSDKDIFLRELVSNACDAIKKWERLKQMGEAPDVEEKPRVDVLSLIHIFSSPPDRSSKK